MVEVDYPINMPDLLGFDRMPMHLDEFGPAAQGAAGIVPVSFLELQAWSEMTGNGLNTWESSMLILMSKQYCYQSYNSDNPMATPPYFDKETESELSVIRAIAQQKIKKMF